MSDKPVAEMTLAELLAAINAKSQKVSEVFTKYGERDPDGDDRTFVINTNKEIEELEKRAQSREEVELVRTGNAKRIQWLNDPVTGRPALGAGDEQAKALGRRQEFPSVAKMLIENDEYKAWYKNIAPHGPISQNLKFDSPADEQRRRGRRGDVDLRIVWSAPDERSPVRAGHDRRQEHRSLDTGDVERARRRRADADPDRRVPAVRS
jgi:hypothetical protein